jgi:hypothetical protein
MIEAVTCSILAAVSFTDTVSASVSVLTDLIEPAISVIATVTSSADVAMLWVALLTPSIERELSSIAAEI